MLSEKKEVANQLTLPKTQPNDTGIYWYEDLSVWRSIGTGAYRDAIPVEMLFYFVDLNFWTYR